MKYHAKNKPLPFCQRLIAVTCLSQVVVKTQCSAPPSPNVMFVDSALVKRYPGDLEDVRVAISGLVNMLKVSDFGGTHYSGQCKSMTCVQ